MTMISASNQQRLIRLAIRMVATKDLSMGQSWADNVANKEGVKQGCGNFFFRLTENWGVKLNKNDREECQLTHDRQLAAYHIGCAPYCFGIFSCIDSKGNQYYGYITQVVAIARDVFWNQDTWALEYQGDRRLKHIKQKLQKKINFPFHDSHANNIGVVGKRQRQLVCIDFGSEGN
jgi:hypothetical protein